MTPVRKEPLPRDAPGDLTTPLPDPPAADPPGIVAAPFPGARLAGPEKLYLYLCAVFITCLVLGDITGGKAFVTPVGPVSVGLLLFPVTFLLTDVINDFYGARAARFITWLGAVMATFCYLALVVTTALPVHPDSYFQQEEYEKILGGSAKLFVASIVAYLIGQLLDIKVFQRVKRLTRSRHLWLRATGSTVLSQLVDTAVINALFWGGVADRTPIWIGQKIVREYLIKVVVAVLLTPVVYAIHAAIVRGLGMRPEDLPAATPKG